MAKNSGAFFLTDSILQKLDTTSYTPSMSTFDTIYRIESDYRYLTAVKSILPYTREVWAIF